MTYSLLEVHVLCTSLITHVSDDCYCINVDWVASVWTCNDSSISGTRASVQHKRKEDIRKQGDCSCKQLNYIDKHTYVFRLHL